MYDAGTALIVVDVQNDFAHPDGSLFVAGAAGVVAAANREIATAVEAGAWVAYTQDWHPERTPHFETDGGVWPVHCVGGTWGAELHAGLVADAGPVVRKGVDGADGYSGFSVADAARATDAGGAADAASAATGSSVEGGGERRATRPTELDGLLRERGVRRVVVVGLATDYCVLETVLDALRLGYGATVPRGGVAAVELEAGDGEAALRRMAEAGAEIAP